MFQFSVLRHLTWAIRFSPISLMVSADSEKPCLNYFYTFRVSLTKQQTELFISNHTAMKQNA